MERPGGERAAAGRVQWLIELADALAQAQRLALRIGAADFSSAEATELYDRLELLRAEVESLRGGRARSLYGEVDPKWTSLSPWTGPDGYQPG